ncbi:MAG: septum formation initiator family protein [Gammaproteobacteria bacterium]|nr:septum formation initiator family protein [Gammaproteobacteria bacterium]
MRTMTFILLIVLAGLQYKLWFGDGSVRDLIKLQKKAEKQFIANQQFDEKNAGLVADIKELKNGHQALEEQARQTLGMVRDNEVYYQIIENRENKPHQ